MTPDEAAVARQARSAMALTASTSLLLAVALAGAGQQHFAGLIVVGLVVGGGLVLEVDLPWGGTVPLGYALLIAAAVALPGWRFAVVAGAGACVALPKWLLEGEGSLARRAASVASTVAAAIATGLVAAGAARLARDWPTDVGIVAEAWVAGFAFLLVDYLLRGRLVAPRAERIRARQAWPIYVALLCAAALLAAAYEQNPAFVLVAGVPLLVTQYSFQRYSSARRTYAQTTQALSLLPEVAGLTPLGHGERTAVYAAAVAEELGLPPANAARVATAARLHHIGYISLHEPDRRTGPLDVVNVAHVGAEILRETGFLADLAPVVEASHHGTAADLEAAIVRVCSSFDDVVAGATDDAFPLVLEAHPEGVERTVALALLQLCDRRPELVEQAWAASEELARVAAHGAAHRDRASAAHHEGQ